MASERTVIFECVHGSHLYGTATEASDEDYLGVFAPSRADHFGLQNCPTEWSLPGKRSSGPRNAAGDVDRKYFSIRRFVQLAGEGQPAQLEMLFAPPDKVLTSTPLWETLRASRSLFLSRRGVTPFLGFAKAQAYKASVKGDNLRLVRALVAGLEGASTPSTVRVVDAVEVLTRPTDEVPGRGRLVGEEVALVRNSRWRGEGEAPVQVEVAGRRWDIGVTVKLLLEGLRKLERAYGTRSEEAAANTYDYKSILHAVRLLGEAEEYLRTGAITLPRPEEEVASLMRIRRKEWPTPDTDVFAYIEERIDAIRQEVEPTSPLPPEPDWKALGVLCVRLHEESMLC